LPRGEPGSNIWDNEVAWLLLTKVNDWLECYAYENENVEFFNATSIFLRTNDKVLIEKFYSDPVHPSAEGHAAWAREIVKRLLKMVR
jgi:lysophospholipase L1-like esterase